MRKRTFTPPALVSAAIIFAMSMVFGAQAATAQGSATAVSSPVLVSQEGGAQAHPAHIHSGTCQDLGEIVFPLSDVAPLGADATPMASPTASPAAGDGAVIAESTTILDTSIDDVLNGDHAVNVHESAENIQNYIACGDITGTPDNGHLRVDLHELNDSGFSGIAELTSNPEGTVTVTITLIQGGLDTMGTPEASPSA